MFNLEPLIRPNIASLKPYVSARSQYVSARSQYVGESLLLDANENPFGDGKENRYPDPYQSELRRALAARNKLKEDQILFGNGSDELIDMLIRVFCEPAQDSILICPPTFGMYEVSAAINDVKTELIPLKKDYQLDVELMVQSSAKIVFLPSPNSPTGNLFQKQDIEFIVKNFRGIFVLDEAYIDFSSSESWTSRLKDFPNLIVLQTFSKYWALAGCRIGMMFASPQIIEVMSKIKMPYNLNNLSAKKGLTALKNETRIRKNADILLEEREKLKEALSEFSFIEKVFPSQTNFLWLKVKEANKIRNFLKESQIIIRGYHQYPDFLRISVGSPLENQKLINALQNYKS